ncbi:MAG: DUF2313 domain-containing protein [Acidobacteria bacterium]|nr:DUF2313 domain-containing protein [Acidobacteriota bacterium]
MSRTASEHATWIARHLPPGLDWLSFDVGDVIRGLGRVFARVYTAIGTFRTDSVPSGATGDRLAAWEDALALPDPDYPSTTTVEERQAEVVRALAQGGTPNDTLYESLADAWDVTADIWTPAGWPYHFWLLGPAEHVRVARAGSAKCGDRLKETSDTWDRIERLVLRHAPGHLWPHFADDNREA